MKKTTQDQEQPKAEKAPSVNYAALLARYPGRVAATAFEPEPSAPWRLVRVRPGAEAKVVEGLRLYGMTVYLPVERVWRPVAHGPKRPHDRPLIRGYVFARLDRCAHLVHGIDGATALLVFDGRLAAVPEPLVLKLMGREAAGAFDQTRQPEPRRKGDRREVGDRVVIRAEAFDGFAGAVVKLKGDRRVKVLLDLVRCAMAEITVELADLEAELPVAEAA